MDKNQMRSLLTSYFNARSAILRELETNQTRLNRFQKELKLLRESIKQRLKNPDKWKPKELSKLAKVLNMSANPERRLYEFNESLRLMKFVDQHRLLKEAFISKVRQKTILTDCNKWHYSELVQLRIVLNRTKDKSK